MENYIALTIGIGILIAVGIAALAVYRWQQAARVVRITGWVNRYLATHYGNQPARLNIICSDDTNWPVLVRFDTPGTGVRHQAQFMCRGRPSEWFLLSERDEQQPT